MSRYVPRTLGLRMVAVGVLAFVAAQLIQLAFLAIPGRQSGIALAMGYLTFVGIVLVFVGSIVALVHYLRKPQPPRQLPPVIVGSAAGWLPDPTDPTILRYWNGTEWTGQTARRDQ